MDGNAALKAGKAETQSPRNEQPFFLYLSLHHTYTQKVRDETGPPTISRQAQERVEGKSAQVTRVGSAQGLRAESTCCPSTASQWAGQCGPGQRPWRARPSPTLRGTGRGPRSWPAARRGPACETGSARGSEGTGTGGAPARGGGSALRRGAVAGRGGSVSHGSVYPGV